MPRATTPTKILIGSNIAALAALAIVELSGTAWAQAMRPRGTYTAVSGRIQGTETHALYVMDESTQEVIAVQWDPRTKQIQGLGYRSLTTDAADLFRPRSN